MPKPRRRRLWTWVGTHDTRAAVWAHRAPDTQRMAIACAELMERAVAAVAAGHRLYSLHVVPGPQPRRYTPILITREDRP